MVSPRVRRPDLDQLDHTATDLHLQPATERPGGHAHVDAVEVERAEEVTEQRTDLAGRRVQRVQHRRRHLGHLVSRRLGRDDLRRLEQLVAVAVIAIGMGVEQGGDRRSCGERSHRVEHLLGELQVEQRVDQQ